MLNRLGARFLEKVYENKLALELRVSGFAVVQNDAVVGGSRCHCERSEAIPIDGDCRVAALLAMTGQQELLPGDLLVEDVPLVELKTVKASEDAHRLRLCLLLNVGRPRLVFGALNAFCAAAPQPSP